MTSGYERSDMDPRGVAAVLGGFGCVVIAAVVLIGTGLHWLARRDAATQRVPTPAQAVERPVPGPTLQTRPQEDLHALTAHEAVALEHYAWRDVRHGSARIPIPRAMALVVGRTLDEHLPGKAAP